MADRVAGPLVLGDALLEALPVGVYVCDADGTIRSFNEEAVRLWGRRPLIGVMDDRFCGAWRLRWLDGRILPHDQTPMAEALTRGTPARNVEVCIERPSGERIIVMVNIVPLLDERRRIVGAVNCFHDVTERYRNEEALRESRSLLSAVVETTPECVKLVARDGRLVQMNSAGLRMIEAASAEEVIGRGVADLIAPEHRADWLERHRRVCDGEVLSWEFDVVGMAGRRRHMETHAVPLRVNGESMQLAITRDVTERVRQRIALEKSEQQARALLEALPVAVYTTDATGAIDFYNAAAAELWGHRPPLGSKWCGSWKIFTPEGEFLPHDQCPMAVALKEARPVRGVEAVAERPDGTRVPFMPHPTPLTDSSGQVVGAVNTLVDISFLKQAHEDQKALINELNHRVKNTLATVQSMAAQSMQRSAGHDSFQRDFTRRLMALGAAHDLLSDRAWRNAELSAILQGVLNAYREVAGGIALSGPPVPLTPRAALAVAMGVNELATNAVKYGALSAPCGHVSIEWKIEDNRLHLRWTEFGGPPVAAPVRKGFGTRLLERTFSGELDGSAELAFDPSGLRCAIAVPLATAA